MLNTSVALAVTMVTKRYQLGNLLLVRWLNANRRRLMPQINTLQ